MRKLQGYQKIFVKYYLISASIFHLYTAYFGMLQPSLQRSIHLTFFLPLVFLLYPATRKSPKDKISLLDSLLFTLSIIVGMYIILNMERLNMRVMFVTPLLPIEQLLGFLNVILVIEAVRRAVVPLMAILISVFVSYIFICQYLPGILYHKAFSFSRIIEMFYLLHDDGIYGPLTGISATYIALFIIFGAFVNLSGIGKFFIDFSKKIAGQAKGGPAKMAVISSGFFGSISGSSTANVYATGTLTIPLMKNLGYSPVFAGAVEAAASTGGQILPPIMGAGAFIMSDILGIPYIKIIAVAALPAILYFVSVGVMVHFEALKLKLKGMSREESMSISWNYLLKKSYLVIPLVVLVYFLLIGFSPFTAAFYAVIAALFVSILNKDAKLSFPKFLEALESGGKNIIMVAIAIAGAGIIISSLTNSGLALSFSSIIITLSKGNLFIVLFLIMIATIILGMGLPTTAAYVIAVSVAAPALSKLGLDLLSAHLFVFYFAVFAAVTPPVAITAYAAANLAEANPISTGFTALRLGMIGFIVPYVFMYDGALLLRGSLFQILLAVFFVLISIIIFCISLTGYISEGIKLPNVIRIILLFFIPILIFPILNNSIIFWIRGILILIFVILYKVIILKSKSRN